MEITQVVNFIRETRRIEGIMDKSLLTQDLYDAIMADNNKFKEYWNIHPEEVEEVFRKFSEKYEDMSKKRPTSD